MGDLLTYKALLGAIHDPIIHVMISLSIDEGHFKVSLNIRPRVDGNDLIQMDDNLFIILLEKKILDLIKLILYLELTLKDSKK